MTPAQAMTTERHPGDPKRHPATVRLHGTLASTCDPALAAVLALEAIRAR